MEDENSAAELREIRAHLRHSDELLRLKTEELDKTRILLDQKEGELKRAINEAGELRLQLGVTKERLRHTERALVVKANVAAKKGRVSRLQAFLASLLFLLASVLGSFGTNMLTSSSPNSIGWFMIALAASAYIIAAIMTTLLVIEGNR